jgi:hypothetical protein
VDDLMPRGTDPTRQSAEIQHLMRACLQYDKMTHDPNHRGSCFKKDNLCRYHCPYLPSEATTAELKFDEATDGLSPRLRLVLITYKRRPAFVFLSNTTTPLHLLTAANIFNRWVLDCKLTFYFASYSTKDQTKDTKSMEKCLTCFEKYISRKGVEVKADPAGHEASRSTHSKGMGRLLSATRAYTGTFVIGAYMAAYLNDGGERFLDAYSGAKVSVADFVAYLEGGAVEMILQQQGGALHLSACIDDYICRPHDSETVPFLWMTLYIFTSRFERIPMSKIGKRVLGQSYWYYTPEHSCFSTHVCVYRKCFHVPVLYTADRPMDRRKLEGSDAEALGADHLHEAREKYALFAIALCVPYRQATDFLRQDESWWSCYTRLVANLPATDQRQQLLQNMQAYYEAFYSDAPEPSPDDAEGDVSAREFEHEIDMTATHTSLMPPVPPGSSPEFLRVVPNKLSAGEAQTMSIFTEQLVPLLTPPRQPQENDRVEGQDDAAFRHASAMEQNEVEQRFANLPLNNEEFPPPSVETPTRVYAMITKAFTDMRR